MPNYEFRCRACGKTFNVTLKVSELEKTKVACPHCRSRKVSQVLTSFFAMTSKKS